MAESKIDSIIAADCGSTTTTAVLIEASDGHYKLIASGESPSTYGPPWGDITVGLQEAVRQIEKETGRVLLTPTGLPISPRNVNQQGVDGVVLVSSAGQPLATVLVGLMQDISLTSARRAAATTYTSLTAEMALDTEGMARRRSVEAQVQAILAAAPDVILLTGGTDGGADRPIIEMANVIAMALQVLTETKPDLIFAGNIVTRAQVADILGQTVNLRAVDNVRPTLTTENLAASQVELENLYLHRKMGQLPGADKLKNWSRFPPTPASKSFAKTIAYLGEHNGLNVLGVNIGSRSTMIATQAQGQHSLTIGSDAGIGHSLAALLGNTTLDNIQRWLPFDMALEDLDNHLLNKCMHPASIPTTEAELLIELALAREALRQTAAQARSGWPFQPALGRRDMMWNLLLAAGSALTRAPHLGQTVLTLLDGLEPWGLTSLALDKNGLLTMLGAIAVVQPMAAVEVAQRSFVNLGTLLAPDGHGYPGKPALKLKIDYADGDKLELEIPYGVLKVIDLPPGQKAMLEMRPGQNFDIGLGQRGRGAIAEVEGGLLGLIIDGRGRPLRLPQDNALRQDQLRQWAEELKNPRMNTNGHE